MEISTLRNTIGAEEEEDDDDGLADGCWSSDMCPRKLCKNANASCIEKR